MRMRRKRTFDIFPHLRNMLFCLEPEHAHQLSLQCLKFLLRGPIRNYFFSHFPRAPLKVMGLDFPNPVGLSAGLDQHGDYFNALSALGFGFIEVGGVTPKPQAGQPRPRIFRLPSAEALINRKGMANLGVDYAVTKIKQRTRPSILGVNIARNMDTPLEKSVDDYVYCFCAVAPYCDYVTLNVSSPNTPGLRVLQDPEHLNKILVDLKILQQATHEQLNKYVPIVVKVAPDLNAHELTEIAECLLANHVDGVIATNTSISRPHVEGLPFAEEAGGLSGAPLRELSTAVIVHLKKLLGEQIPIIGSGGILNPEDAIEKFQAGAKLIQIYTGFIYHGPSLIREIITAAEG